MEREPESSLVRTQTEMEVFDFRIRIAYYDHQQHLEYTRINATSREEQNLRHVDVIASDRGVREVRAKLGNKELIARNAALRCREYDPDATLTGTKRWVAHHYDYLAAHTLLADDKLDYEALHKTLVEEGFGEEEVTEAHMRFEHFLQTEF